MFPPILQNKKLMQKEITFPRSHVKLERKLGLELRYYDHWSSGIFPGPQPFRRSQSGKSEFIGKVGAYVTC